MNTPKYNYGDKVRFNLTLQTGTVECIGTIEIIDIDIIPPKGVINHFFPYKAALWGPLMSL